MKLTRLSSTPVFLPEPTSAWECYNVFNPGVIHHNGLFHMLYRAQGLDWISRIGYAVSPDGIHWNRLREPVMVPHQGGLDSRGVEDPRITEIDGVFYMAYTIYGRDRLEKDGSITLGQTGITPMLARSTNLIDWEDIGPIVAGEFNKDHMLFPRKIGGKYAALHRREPNVWIAYSDDLKTWPEADMARMYDARPTNGWDSYKVGSNGVPIETEHGWLCFYHGVDDPQPGKFAYRTGVILLDRDDPTKVIRRPKDPIFVPEELWEMRGDVPNVVFSCANIVVGDTVYVFYGGGDHVIGLATCKFDALMSYVLNV
jgi:predicted GH43/DUF377 family glycosyl hydrolase